MAARGSSYRTQDFDIAYAHSRENIAKLVRALKPLNPLLRVPGTDEGVAFPFDAHTIYNGGNFTLQTDAGDVDILAHVGGFQGYSEIKSLSTPLTLYGRELMVLTLEGLIKAKRAANREKDRLALPELEVLLEAEQQRGDTST